MSVSGIQGQLLEVTVVECTKLKDTEWISRQDPYVCLEYGNTRFRTRTCTDGGKNPKFQEKFMFTLIEGLREINVVVWNSNTLSHDDFIGSGKIQLHQVLSQGYDDKNWPLHTKTGRYAGEVKLIMHHQKANKPATSYDPSAPPYGAASEPQVPRYSAPPMASTSPYSNPAYPSPPTAYPSTTATYRNPNSAYPPPPPDPSIHSHSMYPPPSAYPAPPYPPHSAYPPPPYPPPSAYPPPPYPPPPHASPYGPPGPYGMYPPPPY